MVCDQDVREQGKNLEAHTQYDGLQSVILNVDLKILIQLNPQAYIE